MILTEQEKESTTVQFDCQATYGRFEALQIALSSGAIEARLYEQRPQACNYEVRYVHPAVYPTLSYDHACNGSIYSLRYQQDSVQCQDSTPYPYWEANHSLVCTDVDPNPPPPPPPPPPILPEKNLGGCSEGPSPYVSNGSE